MFINKKIANLGLLVAFGVSAQTLVAQAQDTPINGTVQSRCIIQTDVAGTYGNPNAYTLTTAPSDGGENAVIRIDVSLANAYYAQITAPESFSSSPALPDLVYWTGDTSVKTVSDSAAMGAYETGKIEQGLMDRYDLTATGSTWFETSSVAAMGGSKAFPGGNYTALVMAECIAK
jgi:hypothetical protein|tara:strand:- start:2638 stop:3162 length:525 start_codon:yes stop_codon:yes gene_type:complete